MRLSIGRDGRIERGARQLLRTLLGFALLAAATTAANAIPLFNRQTGQNCVACHAGGQFPELTPYGRLFKLTGYTIGQRTLPLAVMGVVSYSKVSDTSKSVDPATDFSKNGDPIFATASVFLGGKITDNIGAFAQITYDNYASLGDDGKYHGHTNADNIDVRYADRFISDQRDLIVGVSVNNNPSVSDPWNTAAAWMQYVPVPSPTSSRFIDGNAPYPGFSPGGNLGGVSVYAFLDRRFYAELGGYRTAKGLFSVMSAGLADADITRLDGVNPYWRLAYNHEWGANSLMLGMSGMNSRVFDDPLDTSDPATTHRYNEVGLDAQYQYLLDPHAVTAQVAYMHSRHRYPDFLANQAAAFVGPNGETLANSNSEDTNRTLRAKLTYVYQAKYGGSVGYFDLTGTTNTFNQSAGYDPATLTLTADDPVGANLTGNPATQGWTLEAFWTPLQYVRLGAQYTMYSKYNGASHNYNGFGRNASDNDSLFLYAWFAY
ncbi:MAG TPA: cytochrome C [Burkholderiaceae bacterium]|nr:cytochrome C [Burkholderiaceae bacterium]